SGSTVLYIVFFQCSRVHRDLHSFPTRRSSDLFVARNRDCEQLMGAEKVRYEVEADDRIMAQGVGLGRLSRRLRRKVWFHQDSGLDRKSTRLNSSHVKISYAVFCLKKKKKKHRS